MEEERDEGRERTTRGLGCEFVLVCPQLKKAASGWRGKFASIAEQAMLNSLLRKWVYQGGKGDGRVFTLF